MHTKKIFAMFCFFCTGSQSIECATQKQAVTKFFDDGWRVRADEDVCPECEKLLPKKVLRRNLLSIKKRLLTQRAADVAVCSCNLNKCFTPLTQTVRCFLMKKRLIQKIVVWTTIFLIAGTAKVSDITVAIVVCLGVVDAVLEGTRLTQRGIEGCPQEWHEDQKKSKARYCVDCGKRLLP